MRNVFHLFKFFGIMFMFMFSSITEAKTLQLEMYDRFSTMADWMNTPMLKRYAQETKPLEQKFLALLDEYTSSGTQIVPLGKVEKGKNVILMYLTVEYKEDGKTVDVFNLHSQTLKKKTGERLETEKYLLAGGTRSGTMYNGGYKLKGKNLIIFSQNEVETATEKEIITVKEYKFTKKLKYIRTLD